jgi:hypothetical protein
MAVYTRNNIVTNGMVLNLDAGNLTYPVSRNLFNYTTDLTNGFWSKTRCQITASAGIAPDGTNTAFAMTITDASALVRLTANGFTTSVPGGPYTLSVYVNKGNCTAGFFQLGIYDQGQSVSGIAPLYAMQSNFVPTASTAGFAATILSRTVTDVGSGWYRVDTSGMLSSSISSFSVFFDIANGLGGNKVNGERILLWKPQFEAGTVATPPMDVPTTVRFSPDLSFNGNTGSFSTSRPTWTPNNGGSIAFLATSSGTPTLTYQSTPTINISGSSMTGEVWVKFNRLDYTNNSGSLMYFFRKGNPDTLVAPNNGIWFAYDNRANRSSFPYTCFGNTAGGFGGGSNNFGDVQYNQTFQTGVWNHIAFTINNSIGTLYINGVQKGASKPFTNLNLYNTGSSTTGFAFNDVATAQPTPFEIGTLKLYNRALSQAEITQNYNALKTRFGLT